MLFEQQEEEEQLCVLQGLSASPQTMELRHIFNLL